MRLRDADGALQPDADLTPSTDATPPLMDMGGGDGDGAARLDMGVADAAAVPPMDAASEACDPTQPPSCEGPWRLICRPDGSGVDSERCPDGSVCRDGGCIEVAPNVLLLVDTSSSMNALIADGQNPAECEGEGCPPWMLPVCDDPDDPKTRLGHAKRALHSVLTSESVAGVRLGLQRFPQRQGLHPIPGLTPNCVWGWYANQSEITRHFESQSVDRETLTAGLGQIFPVPLAPGVGGPIEEMLRWLDFSESVSDNGEACTLNRECPGGFCMNDVCHDHDDPELRAIAGTPIGQGLFYAGEYFRHYVVKEGMPCAADADCESPDYQCVDGACRDPFVACRPNVVVVFSDGAETENDEPTDFFNPRIQAKRLHYGLGCAADADCLNGARCDGARCIPPGAAFPERVCRQSDRLCQADAECPEWACQLGRVDCPGECIEGGFAYDDPAEFDLVRNGAGTPIRATVHVVDASGAPDGNSLLALAGGGTHSAVEFADPEALVQRFVSLVSRKADVSACH